MHEDDTVVERVNGIFAEAKRLALGASETLAAYFIVVTLGGVVVDSYPDSAGLQLLLSIAQLAFGFIATAQLIRRGDLAEGLQGGFGTYFGLSLLSGIAIGFGLLLLIIPGIVLFVRWAPAYAFGLVDGQGVGDALRQSWEKTGPHFWPILISLALPVLSSVGFISILFVASDELGNIGLLPSIIANAGVTLAAIVTMAMYTATYSVLRPSNDSFTDVFS